MRVVFFSFLKNIKQNIKIYMEIVETVKLYANYLC